MTILETDTLENNGIPVGEYDVEIIQDPRLGYDILLKTDNEIGYVICLEECDIVEVEISAIVTEKFIFIVFYQN